MMHITDYQNVSLLVQALARVETLQAENARLLRWIAELEQLAEDPETSYAEAVLSWR
jgi:hypothetical protein